MKRSLLEASVYEDIKKIKEIIKNKRILLQIPDGLKYIATKIIDILESFGCDVILSGEPCYGACDIRDKEAILLGCDLILHLGHREFYRKIETNIPIIFIPIDFEVDYNKEELKKIEEKNVGVVSSVNHLKMLKKIAKDLESFGKIAVIGGYILGCWIENAKNILNKVDCFLYVGSGRFHALSLTKLGKNVYVLDLEKNKVEKISKDENIEKKLIIKFEKFKEARSIGILISSKPGQFYKDISKIKEIIKSFNKKVYVIILDRITQENLEGLKIDFFINTACPRIVEDYFKKSLINEIDFLNLLDKNLKKYKD